MIVFGEISPSALKSLTLRYFKTFVLSLCALQLHSYTITSHVWLVLHMYLDFVVSFGNKIVVKCLASPAFVAYREQMVIANSFLLGDELVPLLLVRISRFLAT